MSRTMTVSDSVVVAADPMTLWSAIADPTQMPRWSPENTGAVLTSQPHPLTVGEQFEGTNRRRAWLAVVARWRTTCVVTASDPGRSFEFRVDHWDMGPISVDLRLAIWRYTFEAVPEGTLVTETWTDGRPWPGWAARVFDFFAVSGSTFAVFQRKNIAKTLAALQADFARTAA